MSKQIMGGTEGAAQCEEDAYLIPQRGGLNAERPTGLQSIVK